MHSKIPIVTCVGSHKQLTKLMTMVKVSCSQQNIQISKNDMHVIHETSEGKIYNGENMVKYTQKVV
jgi:hypothetical protein